MAHHSADRPFDDNENPVFKKMLETVSAKALEAKLQEQIGPTDEHLEGRLSPHDEGGIRFRVGEYKGKVIVDFGTPVHSLGMTKPQALELGRLLITRAGYSCRIGFAKPATDE